MTSSCDTAAASSPDWGRRTRDVDAFGRLRAGCFVLWRHENTRGTSREHGQGGQRARSRGSAFVAASGGLCDSITMAGTHTSPRRAVVVEDAAAATKSGKRKKIDAAALTVQPGDHIAVLEKIHGTTYLVRNLSACRLC